MHVLPLEKQMQKRKAILSAYTTEAETYKAIMKNQNLTIQGLLSYITTRAIQSMNNPIYVNLEAPAKTNLP